VNIIHLYLFVRFQETPKTRHCSFSFIQRRSLISQYAGKSVWEVGSFD